VTEDGDRAVIRARQNRIRLRDEEAAAFAAAEAHATVDLRRLR
jgi:hypothetical protein